MIKALRLAVLTFVGLTAFCLQTCLVFVLLNRGDWMQDLSRSGFLIVLGAAAAAVSFTAFRSAKKPVS